MPAAALFRGWCDAPCLLRLKPAVGQRLTDGSDPSRIALHGDGCAAAIVLSGQGRDRFDFLLRPSSSASSTFNAEMSIVEYFFPK